MHNVIRIIKNINSSLDAILAIIVASVLISFGVIMLKQAGALTGSTAGLAFLISYVSPLYFGSAFLIINLPFYCVAISKMGWEFTIKTFFTLVLISLFTYLHTFFIHFYVLNPFYATILGNLIMGLGFIVLLPHQSSISGMNILALWLQEYIGISYIKLQLFIDICVVLASLFIVSLPMLVTSVIGAIILNILIFMNQRNQLYKI